MTGLNTDIGEAATLACLMEAAAPKVGNVHRAADFSNLTFYDFATAAVAIGGPMRDARATGVGRAVLSAIRATQRAANGNVNLGIALLIAPLAAVDPTRRLTTESVGEVLGAMTPNDSALAYEAIRLASPGGLGQVDEMDVADAAPPKFVDAMALAADRDLIALQYASNFDLVLGEMAELLESASQRWGWPRGIIHTQIVSLSRRPDTLILRKCGRETAEMVRKRAAEIVDHVSPDDETYQRALGDLDFWLRSDGHRRNPGATADLIAGSLFALLREQRIDPRKISAKEI